MTVLLVLVTALFVAAMLLMAWLSTLVVLGLATLVVVLLGLATLIVVILLGFASLRLLNGWLSLLSMLLRSASVGSFLRRLLSSLRLLFRLVLVLLKQCLEAKLALVVRIIIILIVVVGQDVVCIVAFVVVLLIVVFIIVILGLSSLLRRSCLGDGLLLFSDRLGLGLFLFNWLSLFFLWLLSRSLSWLGRGRDCYRFGWRLSRLSDGLRRLII